MSVTRIGAALQPAWIRTASALADTSSSFAGWFQALLKQVVAASETAADLFLALVTPASVIALVLGLWRITADLGWTEAFPISAGFFSHWQVWIALAIGLRMGAASLSAKSGPKPKTSEEN